MSTKRLSRTIIEGGKRGYDKHERKLQIQKNRRASRDFCQTYSGDDDTELLTRKGKHYYREFDDNLSALHKFMEAHVGQPWDDIWSKLCSMADRRNIRGFHFLEHAKYMVFGSMGAENKSTYWGFYLEDGILGLNPKKRYKRSNYKEARKIESQYLRWMGDRQIHLVGSKYFWYTPVRKVARYIDGEYRQYVAAWRQGNQLTKKEVGHMEWVKIFSEYLWKKLVYRD